MNLDDDPFEPLTLSAALADAKAPELCYRDALSGESCISYHSIWQYLRLLGIITTVRSDAGFFRSTLRANLRSGACRRILISGTADYGLLAQIGAAVQAEQVAVAITVLDLCPTPLYLNTWYAERIGLTITGVASDIFAFTTPEPFDLICTHSFLSRFPAERRWARPRKRWRTGPNTMQPIITAIRSNRWRNCVRCLLQTVFA